MKTEVIYITENNRSEAIEAAAAHLKEGAIVAFPTDTVYGLGAVYSDAAAVRKIFAAKGRDEKKPLSVLVENVDQVYELAKEVPPSAKVLMEKFWPGALTIILKKAGNVPCEVSAGDTIGIRMPASELARDLIRAAKSPLAAPSANLSGKRSAASGDDVREDLDGRIEMILDGGSCPEGISSTVVDTTGEEPVILREGSISAEMINGVL